VSIHRKEELMVSLRLMVMSAMLRRAFKLTLRPKNHSVHVCSSFAGRPPPMAWKKLFFGTPTPVSRNLPC
jgi:hypothetical protein